MGESAIRRRLAHAARAVRWAWKRVRGVPGEIRVDLRWRLGDEVMALPIYGALGERYPGSRVSVLCNYPDLLVGNPHATAAGGEGPCADWMIDLRSGPRDVYRLEHYARLAGVPTPTERPRLYYGDWHTPLLEELGEKFVVVAAGASWQTKRWSAENWKRVCGEIKELGYSVVELGHEGEEVGAGVSLAGRTSIRDAACVLHAARLVVTCDSGLMHLGLAAGARVVALFGPTDPDILIRNEPLFRPIRSGLECRGCWNRREGAVSPGVCPDMDLHPVDSTACMRGISAEQVIGVVRELLS